MLLSVFVLKALVNIIQIILKKKKHYSNSFMLSSFNKELQYCYMNKYYNRSFK